MDSADPYVTLAKQAIVTYAMHRQRIGIPESLPQEMTQKQGGVFVSLKKAGILRGCIGTLNPTTTCLAEEIIANAISASSRDPRFRPVTPEELEFLSISVDVLHPSEHISSVQDLNPLIYGVIVSHHHRTGVLLPMLEGIDDPSDQVRIALQKAGIDPKDPYVMKRFKVDRHL